MRMSQDEMAALIGVSKRTIAAWSERPEIVIRPDLQRALDTAYERAGEAVKLRFVRQLEADDSAATQAGSATALTVAIATREALAEGRTGRRPQSVRGGQASARRPERFEAPGSFTELQSKS